jgi:hypothetical protein
MKIVYVLEVYPLLVTFRCVGYCYGDSTCGQRAVYQLGMTGVPIYNVRGVVFVVVFYVLDGGCWLFLRR